MSCYVGQKMTIFYEPKCTVFKNYCSNKNVLLSKIYECKKEISGITKNQHCDKNCLAIMNTHLCNITLFVDWTDPLFARGHATY